MKRDEPIAPEAAEGMGLLLNDDERRKRAEALRRSQVQAQGIAMDWTAAVYRARQHLGARKRTFSEAQSLALIDDLAERGTATAAEMQRHGSADMVGTILGHVTTAVHGGGTVPAADGWYRKNAAGTVYVINPGFAAAWKPTQATAGPSSTV